jgi:hypothetical protein
MKIEIKSNFPDVIAKLNRLSDDMAKVVLVRTVNRVTDQAKTQMARSITAEFNLGAAKVKDKLVVSKASFKGGRYTVSAELLSRVKGGKTRSLNLINFAGRPGKKGVTFKVKKAGARQTIKGSFIGNKGRTVFARTGDARLPIKALQSIDVPQMFNTKRINAAVIRSINERFPVVFERELAYALTQFKAKP